MGHLEGLKAYKAKEYEKALELWSVEAENENDQAMTNIALMYLKGEGVAKDYKKALEWFEKALKYENISAYYNVGLMYQNGIGQERDIEKATEFLTIASEANHAGANFRLAILLLRDRSDLESVKKGFECMINSAKSSYPLAKAQISGIDIEPNKNCEKNETFRALSKQEQEKSVMQILEKHIKPTLQKDGGDIVLVEYKNDEIVEIKLIFQGACAGCSLASSSTYQFIRETLSKNIDEYIKVYIL